MRSMLEGGQGHVESVTDSRKMFESVKKVKFTTQQKWKIAELTKQERDWDRKWLEDEISVSWHIHFSLSFI